MLNLSTNHRKIRRFLVFAKRILRLVLLALEIVDRLLKLREPPLHLVPTISSNTKVSHSEIIPNT